MPHRPLTAILTRLRRTAPAAAFTVATLAGGVGLTSGANASAQSVPFQTTGYVNVRPGPSVLSGNPLTVLPPNYSPDVNCWAVGQNVGGVNVWMNVTYNGVTGFYASFFDTSTYTTDNQITSKYGIPECGQQAPTQTPPTSQGQNAANWAAGYIGSTAYSGLCLAFVQRSWADGAGVNIVSDITVPVNSNTYPVDIWGHFNTGTTGSGDNPPIGALVFYASKTGNPDLSHVTITVGAGGQEVSTADAINERVIHTETIAQHSYANMLGWWLP